MSFFKNIPSTLYNPEFYRSLPNQSTWVAIRYLGKLALTLSFVGAVLSGIFFSPLISQVLNDVQKEVLENYPTGLEIKIEKGIATTNAKTEPLFFPIKENWKKIENIGGESETKLSVTKPTPDYFFILYTAADQGLTPESFKNMRTYSLLTSKHFVAYDKDNNIVFRDLSDFGDTTINEETITRIFTLARFIPFTIPFLYFLGIFIGVCLLGIFLMWVAVFYYMIERIAKNPILFKDAYKVCVFAGTAPIVVLILFILSGMPVSVIFLLFTLMTLLLAIINTKPRLPESIV